MRQSISNAWPATPNIDASWSINPPGTPVAATSAASAMRAVSRGSNSRPAVWPRARVSATESAELDDRPEPGGTVDDTSRSTGGSTARPAPSTFSTPATNRPHVGSTDPGCAPPSTGTRTSPGTCSETARTPGVVARLTRTVHARSIAIGSTKPSL